MMDPVKDLIVANRRLLAFTQLGLTLAIGLAVAMKDPVAFNIAIAFVVVCLGVVNFAMLTVDSWKTEDTEYTNRKEEVGKLKAEFLANMSHELRTPLNSIIGFSQMLQDQVIGELNEQQKRYIGYIIGGGKNLEQMINDILDLAKIESGKTEIIFEEFPLTEVVVDVINGLNELIEQKNIRFALDVDMGLSVTADKLKIKQIIFNLLSNAVKFTPNAGQIALVGKEVDSGILVSVSDTGIGIRESDLERVFNLFEQGDSSMTKTHHGTGLGLALVKTLIEMHSGSIWAESALGKGSTFSFVIPVVKDKIVKLET